MPLSDSIGSTYIAVKLRKADEKAKEKSNFSGQPGINQFAGEAQLAWNLRQVVFREEGTGAQLLRLQLQGASGLGGCEADHQAARVGPRLTGEITQLLDFQSGFFAHLPTHALLQGFAHLDKAGHQAMEVASEIAGMYQ